MRIALVTDVVLADWVGGGTLVNDYMASRMRASGHQVEFLQINPQRNDWDSTDHTAIDLYLVTNIPHMNGAQIAQLVHSGKPYLVLRHDIASVCYLDEAASHPAAAVMRLLFGGARANIFISPIQLAYYKRVCDFSNTLVVPPPLDLDAFVDQQQSDRAGHLYIGEISVQRGIVDSLQAMQAQADGTPMAFVGQSSDAQLLQAIEAAGGQRFADVAHAAIPALLNRYRHFHYHPHIIDAFCLKVVEAELCGMTLHVNKANIGRYYFDATARQLADYMKQQSMNSILAQIY
jgi:hypothetical protein